MRNHDFVSGGLLAVIATCLVRLCSIALLAWLWRTSSPPKSRLRSIMYAKRLDAINSRRRKWRTTTPSAPATPTNSLRRPNTPFNDASRFEAILRPVEIGLKGK